MRFLGISCSISGKPNRPADPQFTTEGCLAVECTYGPADLWTTPPLSSRRLVNNIGATIIGPQADLNLGITTYINGVETNPVQIDTSAAATDTIDYVATDQSGLTSTSTRTVIIEAPASASANDIASTTSPQSAQGSTSAQ